MKTSVKYNKSNVLKNAWSILRKSNNLKSWSDCMKDAWNIEKNGFSDISISTIYNKYFKQIFNYVLNKIHKYEIAQEITQDIFLKVNEHINNYDVDRASLKTWIYKIANNKVIDYWRSLENRTKDLKTQISDFQDENGKEYFQIADNSDIETYTNGIEINEAVSLALSNLKPEYRKIAELCFIEGLKYNEISEKLNIPMGTVKGNINRIRAMLQESLQSVYQN
jgi:RNA polymerase sigma-70 factor (ECF subfamily)